MKHILATLQNRKVLQRNLLKIYLFDGKWIDMTHHNMTCLYQKVYQVGASETCREFEYALVVVVETVRDIESLTHHFIYKVPDTIGLFFLCPEA